ncbi:hypothetical protein BDZ89DRAFT_1057350 [Hymenopellis radicata]|nr:hypothetical protein BDZ89DRAFT_1057350 [Hymenopellis radicata]
MATKQQTLTAAIKEDHEEMYEYYDNYVKANGNPDEMGRWARQLTWEIARHAVGEEIVVYPLMEKYMGDQGVKLTDGDRAEHQQVKVMLNELESIQPGSPDHQEKLKKVMEHLRKHNDSEEQNDLPALEPLLGREDSITAASSFTRTKKFVPTRAHPSAPNKPPYETLVGFMTMPIDKLKDMFSAFPTEEMKENAK